MINMKVLKLRNDEDYNTFKEWCITIYDYYRTLDASPTGAYMVDYFMNTLRRIDQKRSLRMMKALYKETNELFREDMLGKDAMYKLNGILKDKFAHCISDEIEIERNEVDGIVKSGKIRNNHEYELIKRREEEIYADETQNELADTLRNLMAEYESLKNK